MRKARRHRSFQGKEPELTCICNKDNHTYETLSNLRRCFKPKTLLQTQDAYIETYRTQAPSLTDTYQRNGI